MLCHGFARPPNGCSHDSATCERVQAASASVDERPPTDAEPPDGENEPDWGNTYVDRRLAKSHVNCGHVHPTVLAQRLRDAGYPNDVTPRARQLY
eukprot:8887343-Lingulodinium_polyedra.AAC.1